MQDEEEDKHPYIYEADDKRDNSPSKFSSEDQQEQPDLEQQEEEDEKFPILFLDVNLGKGKVDRLVIMDGDDPLEIANKFCELHQLTDKKKRKLISVIKQQLTGMLTRIDEDEEDNQEED